MTNPIRIACAQLNFTVGDIQGNLNRIVNTIEQARAKQIDIICFPELALTGYPPEDLLARQDFLKATEKALDAIAAKTQDIAVLIGHPQSAHGQLTNCASWIADGKTVARYFKRHLPNRGVFDEKRYFAVGEKPLIVQRHGLKLGILICEDIWHQSTVKETCDAGAEIIISINASPFHQVKSEKRTSILQQQARDFHIPIVYAHMIGGQDELIFDGGSKMLNADGTVCVSAATFVEELLIGEIMQSGNQCSIVPSNKAEEPSHIERIYSALQLGLKDYVHKNHFESVVIGISGGIDSALTLAIAVDALGAENVTGIMLASRYTSKESVLLAQTLCENFGVDYEELSIEAPFQAFLDTLYPLFAQVPVDKTEENIQARTRAVMLMAFANKFNKLLITTGNKSEMACGYATLYGDMAGAYALLKDVYKTIVYQLARFRNRDNEMIPNGIIDRAPTAELAKNQFDQDSLPPYETLDSILALFIEEDKSLADIIAAGFDATTVKQVIAMVKRNEYKRRQAPPGPRITTKAFGRDRRYPITNGFDFCDDALS